MGSCDSRGSSTLSGTMARDRGRLVRRNERGAATIQVPADDGGHQFRAVTIEVRVRLVEDPQRRAGEHHAGES